MLTIHKTTQHPNKKAFEKSLKQAKEKIQHHLTSTGIPDPKPTLSTDILAVLNGADYQFSKLTKQEYQQQQQEAIQHQQQEALDNKKQQAQQQPSPDYAEFRLLDYPNIGDQLDAIMKGFAHLASQKIKLPKETQTWLNTCQLIKTRYPKPNDK